MLLLLALFSVFSISIPVILESRRTSGDHILKQVGREITGSQMVQRFSKGIGRIPQTALGVAASATMLAIPVMLLMVIRWLIRLLF